MKVILTMELARDLCFNYPGTKWNKYDNKITLEIDNIKYLNVADDKGKELLMTTIEKTKEKK